MKKILVPFFVAVSLILSACSFDNKLMAFISDSIVAIPVDPDPDPDPNPENPSSATSEYDIMKINFTSSVGSKNISQITVPDYNQILLEINAVDKIIDNKNETIPIFITFYDKTNLEKVEVLDSEKSKLGEYTVFNDGMQIYTISDFSIDSCVFYIKINEKLSVKVTVTYKVTHVCLDPDTITVENVTSNGNLTVKNYKTTKDGNPCWRVTALCQDSVDLEDAVNINFEQGLPAVFYMNNDRNEQYVNIIKVPKINDLFESPLEFKCAKDNTTLIIDAIKISDWKKTTVEVGNADSFYSGFKWCHSDNIFDFVDKNFENCELESENVVTCRYVEGFYEFSIPCVNTAKIYPKILIEYSYTGLKNPTSLSEYWIDIDLYSVNFKMTEFIVNTAFKNGNTMTLTMWMLDSEGKKMNVKEYEPCSIALRNNIK